METLPTPPYRNANPPIWFLAVRDGQQAQMDMRYLHGPADSVDAYNAAAKGWLDDQTRKRELSADPASYLPPLFTRPIPRREVWDISEDGAMYTWQMDPDPNIHPPVLPPYVAPQQGGGFRQLPDPKDAALFTLLAKIQADIAAVRAKVGA